MLTIDTIYVQVMDPSSDLLIYSNKPAQGDEDINRFMMSKLQRCFTNKGFRQGVFTESNRWLTTLQGWQKDTLSFAKLVEVLANDIFLKKKECGCYDASDVWIGEVVYEERRYLIIVDNAYKNGITHQVDVLDDQTRIDLIRDCGFYQDQITKEDSVILIEKSDLTIQVLEHCVDTAGLKVNLYADKILACAAQPSYPQSVKLVTKAVETVLREHDLDQNKVLPKMKQLLVEGTEAKRDVDISEMAEVLFSQPIMQKAFHEQLVADGLPAFIPTAQGKAVRKERVQKLKTDNGIELSIPIDYMNQNDLVEIDHQSDGTITIRIKKINHINSK